MSNRNRITFEIPADAAERLMANKDHFAAQLLAEFGIVLEDIVYHEDSTQGCQGENNDNLRNISETG